MKLKYQLTGIEGSVIRTKVLDPLEVTVIIKGNDFEEGKSAIEAYLFKKFLLVKSITLVEITDFEIER